MKIKDLIALLQQCDPEAEAHVWDSYDDAECHEICVSVGASGMVHVGSVCFGTPIKPPG